jgi:hypothetical protein
MENWNGMAESRHAEIVDRWNIAGLGQIWNSRI